MFRPSSPSRLFYKIILWKSAIFFNLLNTSSWVSRFITIVFCFCLSSSHSNAILLFVPRSHPSSMSLSPVQGHVHANISNKAKWHFLATSEALEKLIEKRNGDVFKKVFGVLFTQNRPQSRKTLQKHLWTSFLDNLRVFGIYWAFFVEPFLGLCFYATFSVREILEIYKVPRLQKLYQTLIQNWLKNWLKYD